MFSYMICNEPDEEIFNRQCKAIEDKVPNIELVKTLHDVDDSRIKVYNVEGKEIKVSNDYYNGGVFIKSEIELEQFFK